METKKSPEYVITGKDLELNMYVVINKNSTYASEFRRTDLQIIDDILLGINHYIKTEDGYSDVTLDKRPSGIIVLDGDFEAVPQIDIDIENMESYSGLKGNPVLEDQRTPEDRILALEKEVKALNRRLAKLEKLMQTPVKTVYDSRYAN